jgi:hypothetical protein
VTAFRVCRAHYRMIEARRGKETDALSACRPYGWFGRQTWTPTARWN